MKVSDILGAGTGSPLTQSLATVSYMTTGPRASGCRWPSTVFSLSFHLLLKMVPEVSRRSCLGPVQTGSLSNCHLVSLALQPPLCLYWEEPDPLTDFCFSQCLFLSEGSSLHPCLGIMVCMWPGCLLLALSVEC